MKYTTRWLSDKARIKELIDFFITHKTESYISHGEIISGRALGPGLWNPDLEMILQTQFSDDFKGSGTELKILVAENDNGVIIGMLVFHLISGFKNYAVLEDMLLDQAYRGQSVGSRLLEKAIEESKSWNIGFMMLESGVSNTGAHHFFEKYGFKKVSENYILNL